MKRRIARKIDNYKVMPQRLTNKAMLTVWIKK